MTYIDYCIKNYKEIFDSEYLSSCDEAYSQKKAIRETIIGAMREYPKEEPAEIWKTIYSAHVHRKSGIISIDVINSVISADNSWKKSSGHAFEEMIKLLGNDVLNHYDISILLQKDLNNMIKLGEIHNEVRDISWLKEQIKSSVFDLYSVIKKDDKNYVYGCIQSKTSIRDRVTRDREPSQHAMQAYFWSVALVLNGDFLRLAKFQNMVNGGTTEHPHNGWHGMYVFSDKYSKDRIYPIGIEMTLFIDHAVKASNQWLSQRQWFTNEWRP